MERAQLKRLKWLAITLCAAAVSKAADAKGEALLAVQQMRNIVVASTLMVMGMSQLLGRMYNTMLT